MVGDFAAFAYEKSMRTNVSAILVDEFVAVGGGVKLDDDEVANIIEFRKKRRYLKQMQNNNNEWIKKPKDQKSWKKIGKQVRNCSSSSARPRTPVKKQSA